MADVFLVNNNQLSPTDYNWDAAFNNQEFINYIATPINYSQIYIDNEKTYISDYEYTDNSKFKSIVTSATFSVCYLSVGSHTFELCSKLRTISFPMSIYQTDPIAIKSIMCNIGEYAFADCISLTDIYINTNRKYKQRAFYNCPSLYIFYMGYTSNPIGPMSESYWLNDIDDECFALSSSASKFLYLRNNASYINRIGKSAFEYRKFDMYPGVGQNICKFIDDYAFKNTNTYNSVIFNDYASKSEYKNFDLRLTLGKNIFQGCSAIYTIKCYGAYSIYSDTFGSDVKSTLRSIHTTNDDNALYSTFKTDIKSHAFENYSKLNYVYMYNVGVVEEYAFANCTSLNGFYTHVGELLCDEIRDYAFYGCTNLSQFTCNKSASYVNGYITSSNLRKVNLNGSHIFDGCTTLKMIDIINCGDLPSYLFSNFSAFSSVYLNVSIPSTMPYSFNYRYSINIGRQCFYNCSSLDNAYIRYINKIGESAFGNCSSLKYFGVGDELCSEIGSNAFENCSLLSRAVFNSNYYSLAYNNNFVSLKIYEKAFLNCTLISIISLYNTNYIGSDAFKGCDSLLSLYLIGFNSSVIPSLINLGGLTSESRCTIYVPSSMYSSFIADTEWSQLSNIISTI